jgi:coenzyme F420-dependent oxidoreductase
MLGRNYQIGPDEYAEHMRIAESLGYDSVWVHESWGKDAFALLNQLAVKTTKIKLGTSIVTVWSRTPTLLAQAAASVDEVSNGRLILGLGVTGPKVVTDWMGLKWEKPLQRTREYVDIIRLVISGSRVNYQGEIFQLRDFQLQFQPYRPSIPIYIGAYGPKNIALAGEIADGWLGGEICHYNIPQFIELLSTGARKAGRSHLDLTVSVGVGACVSKDSKALGHIRDLQRQDIAYRIGGLGPYHHAIVARQGFEEECADIKRLWTEFRRDEAVARVPDAIIDGLSVAGTAEDVRQRIQEVSDKGVDLIMIGFPRGVSREMILETMEALAP